MSTCTCPIPNARFSALPLREHVQHHPSTHSDREWWGQGFVVVRARIRPSSSIPWPSGIHAEREGRLPTQHSVKRTGTIRGQSGKKTRSHGQPSSTHALRHCHNKCNFVCIKSPPKQAFGVDPVWPSHTRPAFFSRPEAQNRWMRYGVSNHRGEKWSRILA